MRDLRELFREVGRGARAVRVRPLPLVAELGDRSLLAVGDEDRVVAEALAAARLVGDAAFERPCAAVLRAVGRERDELADVTRARRSSTPSELRAAAGRRDRRRRSARNGRRGDRRGRRPRSPSPRRSPRPRGSTARPKSAFAARVLVVGLAVSGGYVVGVEQLDLPPGQRGAQLAQLALVLRAEPRYRPHWTPCTKSRSPELARAASRTACRA